MIEKKKGLYNILFGFVGQAITVLLGIIVPRLFLLNLGSAANGLFASVGQVLSYLSLLEAGIGGASIQALYSPLAKKNKESVNCILVATKQYYKKTGTIYFVCVLGISIVYPTVIKEFSYLTVMSVVLLSGIPGVINYYFQGYYKVLLQAEGKSYIISNIGTIISIVTSIVKVVLITKGIGIVQLQGVYCVISLLQMIIYRVYIKNNYTWLDMKKTPDFSAISKKGSVLIHQIAEIISCNVDVVVLTIFTNLKVVSIYTLYNMIFDVVNTAVQIVGNSISYIFGNTYYTDKIRFRKLYEAYELYFYIFTYSIYTVVYFYILPFIRIYTRGINDIGYLDQYLPLLFLILKLLACTRTPCINIINVVGHFKETQKAAIIEAIINFIISIISVIKFGIYGVLIGTICGLLYRMIYTVYYINVKILERMPLKSFKRFVRNFLLTAVIIIVYRKLHIHYDDNYVTLLLNAVFSTFGVLMTYIIVNCICGEFKVLKSVFKILR